MSKYGPLLLTLVSLCSVMDDVAERFHLIVSVLLTKAWRLFFNWKMFSHKINMQETLHQAAHSVSSAFNNCKENYDWIHSNYFKTEQQKRLPDISWAIVDFSSRKECQCWQNFISSSELININLISGFETLSSTDSLLISHLEMGILEDAPLALT